MSELDPLHRALEAAEARAEALDEMLRAFPIGMIEERRTSPTGSAAYERRFWLREDEWRQWRDRADALLARYENLNKADRSE